MPYEKPPPSGCLPIKEGCLLPISSPSGELANFGLLKPRESNLHFFLSQLLKKGGQKAQKKTSKQDVDKNITAGARWQNPRGLVG